MRVPTRLLAWSGAGRIVSFLVLLLWVPVTVAYEWHVEVVDNAGTAGRDTSLSLDESGQPHVSYYDGTKGALKYARASGPTATVLTGPLVRGELVLSWTAVAAAAAYWVYGAGNIACFEPGFAPSYERRLVVPCPRFQPWSSPNGSADLDHN